MVCMVRHQPTLARFASPQAQGCFGRTAWPSLLKRLGRYFSGGFSSRAHVQCQALPTGGLWTLLLGSPWVLLPGGPRCRAVRKGMVLPVCKVLHQFKQLSPRGIQRVLGGPCLWGTKRVNFQERTLQTPFCTVATHLQFTKSAFLCGNKEKA